MLVNDIKTKEKYENIKEAEGYIQLSGEELKIYNLENSLPTWEELHVKHNFILEAHFFNPKNSKSISIKQVNDEYKYYEITLSEDELKNANIFQAKQNTKVKIATIWKEQKDELCESFEVLKPIMQVFAGFEGGEER